MSTVKRQLEASTPPADLPKRKGSKPGRKPLDTEAKNKRTAQNRAAQRAFRERKERKMRELEEQVERLEKVREQSEMESEFLRSQLQMLIAEIQKYRPQQSSDSQVLKYLAEAEERCKAAPVEKRTGRNAARSSISTSNRDDSENASRSRSRSTSLSEHNTLDTSRPQRYSENSSPADQDEAAKINANVQRKMNFTFEYPKDMPPANGAFPSPSGSTSTTSNHSFSHRPFSQLSNTPRTSSGSLDFLGDSASNTQSLPKFPTSESGNGDFDFNTHFDEQVSVFCTQMNEVCGTRECPLPQALPPSTAASVTPRPISPIQEEQPELSKPAQAKIPAADAFLKQAQQQQPPNAWDSPQFGHSGFGMGTEDPTNRWLFPDFSSGNMSSTVRAPSAKIDSVPFIDTSMAFPTDQPDALLPQNSDDVLNQFFEEDPIVSQLTTEESNYDPFKPDLQPSADSETSKHSVSSCSNDSDPSRAESNASTALTEPNYTIDKTSVPSAVLAAEDADVVPARDGLLLKCSEIWDRITAHPKYSDIDIDGLCMELRTKAKCSEKGVVVNSDDVQSALAKHMS
ncbi:KLTH0G03784p [Lachancea thermotolerans CBS 6340]|uniref:KLTH0G03784p n=1 Tax=Lachancea thermotolerans (strain ATCC 56472 / CBS 6340 / NRRL Y-8284) TaxID=559295 RepID=C5DLV2_LACTC|nr:KLTH0G03784p [Lachancea thermotolerans CBS 6340]CAR24763.1 KLTH0G03784p [Lachancea thermotolerans CBS 6340]